MRAAMSKATTARSGGLGAIGLLGLLFLAAPAHATLYCVPTTTGCPAGAVASSTVQSALNSAEAAGDDDIVIQPGTYTGNFAYEPSIANAGTLYIVPRVQRTVTLRSNTNGGTTLKILGDSNDSDTLVQDLIIDAPDGGVALSTFGDVGSPVIRAASGAQGATGLVLYGSSTATSANIQMDDNGQPANRGLDIAESVGNWAGDATISGSVIDSMDGVNASNGFSLKTTVLVTGQRGIDVLCAGSADIDTVVHTVTGGYGLRATSSTQCGPADPAIVDVRHLTLVAENAFAGPALRVFANQNGLARITVRSSIVLGFESVVEKVVDTVPGTKAELKVGYSLADLTLITPQSNDGPATNLGGNFVADPLFSDPPGSGLRAAVAVTDHRRGPPASARGRRVTHRLQRATPGRRQRRRHDAPRRRRLRVQRARTASHGVAESGRRWRAGDLRRLGDDLPRRSDQLRLVVGRRRQRG
jgi:hypothetical protein